MWKLGLCISVTFFTLLCISLNIFGMPKCPHFFPQRIGTYWDQPLPRYHKDLGRPFWHRFSKQELQGNGRLGALPETRVMARDEDGLGTKWCEGQGIMGKLES
jgi:hypothetical protein